MLDCGIKLNGKVVFVFLGFDSYAASHTSTLIMKNSFLELTFFH